MQLHANAALSLIQRRRMVRRVVDDGWSLTEAAEAAEVSDRTCSKWVARYRAEGDAGLRDRSSAPRRIPHRTPVDRVEVIELVPPAVQTDLTPGQATRAGYQPLDEFADEVMALLRAEPAGPEILVERVKELRFAERDGRVEEILERFAAL